MAAQGETAGDREWGLWSDEGCVERGFWSHDVAEEALAERYSPDDGLSVLEMCAEPGHEGTRHSCDDCAAEGDAEEAEERVAS